MSSGAKVDAIVGNFIMGLNSVGYYKRSSCHSGDWIPCAEGDVTEDHPQWTASLMHWPMTYEMRLLGNGPRAIPRYSTDDAHAMLVVEKLRKAGHVITIKADGLRKDNPKNPNYTVLIDDEQRIDADTMPEAVVMAALQLYSIGIDDEIKSVETGEGERQES